MKSRIEKNVDVIMSMLEEKGIRVIRFENQEVLQNLEKVLTEIKQNFKKITHNIKFK